MGIGLQGAYGLENAQQGLRQRIFDQLAQKRQEQEIALAERRQAMLEAEQKAREQDRADLAKSLIEERAARIDAGKNTQAVNAFTLTPKGGQLPAEIAGRLQMMGAPVTTTPGVSGPAAAEGIPTDMGGAPPIALPSEATPTTFQRGETQADIDRQTNLDAQVQARKDAQQARIDAAAEAEKNRVAAARQSASDRENLARVTAGLRQPQTVVVQTVDAQGNPVQKVVPKTAGAEYPAAPTAAQKGQVSENDAVASGLSKIRELANTPEQLDSWVGPIQGPANKARMAIPGFGVDPSMAEFYAEVSAIKNRMIRAITGAQMSEPEATRIMSQLPDVNQKPVVFNARLAATERNLKAINDAIQHKSNPTDHNETPEQRRARLRKAAGL